MLDRINVAGMILLTIVIAAGVIAAYRRATGRNVFYWRAFPIRSDAEGNYYHRFIYSIFGLPVWFTDRWQGRYATGGLVNKPDLDLSVIDNATPALRRFQDQLSRRPAPRPAAIRPDASTGVGPEVTSDEGEPLAVPAPPNIGGVDHPDYKGPHYDVPHTRFIPYDMLTDPIPGTAVHAVGKVAVTDTKDAEKKS